MAFDLKRPVYAYNVVTGEKGTFRNAHRAGEKLDKGSNHIVKGITAGEAINREWLLFSNTPNIEDNLDEYLRNSETFRVWRGSKMLGTYLTQQQIHQSGKYPFTSSEVQTMIGKGSKAGEIGDYRITRHLKGDL